MAAIFILLASLAGVCVATMDRIQHYNNFGLGWWSREAYHCAKYEFIDKHPRFPKWFINSFLVMFLDAWHFSKLLMILLFFTMVGYYGSWEIGIAGFIIYQITFITCYGKKT
jgi:hypothetical protein